MRVNVALVAAVGASCALADAQDGNETHRVVFMANDDPVCYWEMGLSCDLNEAVNNLRLGVVDKCELPVPVPIDNYVEDLRRNKYDNAAKTEASQEPFIQITSARRGGTTVQSTKKTAWYQYGTNPKLVQSEIAFDAPGLYDLEIVANDYVGEVSCIGCVAILDEFRPRYGTAGTCPAALTTPQTLTKTTLTAFQAHDTAYTAFTKDSNVVNNANSGVNCGTLNVDRFSKRKIFYENENVCYTSCFDDATLLTNVAKLKTTPFTVSTTTAYSLQTPYATMEPLLNEKCTWCCKKKRTLKEMVTLYACPTDYENEYPDTPDADCKSGTGIPNTCSIDVCLQAKGADVITASVSIKDTIQTASNGVLNALPSKPAGSDATKNVYYSIPCTTFDRTNINCRYTVKLSQLLDVTNPFATTFPAPTAELTKSKDYVFWRYNTDGTNFVKWDPLSDTAIAFTDASTTINLEAWTACGRAYSTSFSVNLFLHSTLACSKFDAMWSVMEKPGVQGSEGTYCAYGGSDFAVLKLDMKVADVLLQTDSTVTGTYTGVKCDIMVKPTGGSDTQVVTIVDSTATTISKNYGVELVNNPTTAQKTTGVVHCKFTRTPRTNILALAGAVTATDTNTIDCSHTFTITDCDKPELAVGTVQDVCADRCAGDSAPGVLEACGGSIVTSSATNTILKPSTELTCCSKCTQALSCKAVGTTDVKRCEPPRPAFLLSQSVNAEKDGLWREMAAALLGATTMVAVAALIVVKHRADVAARAAEAQYAYSLLLA
ncbi:unnamed protein product [Phytophthora lilii]|uniref:Unnamed protein product n=1 Tax=Phytophthora lilii TaxID=2077276 RepID=A0A9W6TL86_9STRA|nr:unnamed protein product [Phytophthora lilii]